MSCADDRRTHRERKEQYMRALETEVSRLREAYSTEISDANVTIQQQKEENEILKEILVAHGIQYEPEFEQRRAERAAVGFQSSPVAASSNGSHTAGLTHSTGNQNTTPGTSISTGLSPLATGCVGHSEVSPPMAFAPQQQVYHSAPAENFGAQDRSACQMGIGDNPVPAVRGVFEEDYDLMVEFIVTYVFSSSRSNKITADIR